MSKDDSNHRSQALRAYELKKQGLKIKQISSEMGLHISRISDLIRSHQRELNHPTPEFHHELSRRAITALWQYYGSPHVDTKEDLIEAIRSAQMTENHRDYPFLSEKGRSVILRCGKKTKLELMEWAGIEPWKPQRLPSIKKLLKKRS